MTQVDSISFLYILSYFCVVKALLAACESAL